MNLSDLIEQVKQERLTKSQLEALHNQLSSLFATYQIEMSDLTKEEARFLNDSQEEKAVFSQRKWAANEKGQRQIQLKYEIRALEKLLSSVKSRIYSTY